MLFKGFHANRMSCGYGSLRSQGRHLLHCEFADSNSKLTETSSHSRGPVHTSFALHVLPSENQRAQRMPGAWCARSRAWSAVNTRVSHHGHTGNTRHSPRDGFNGFLRALPGDRRAIGLFVTSLADIDVSGPLGLTSPHDFAAREPVPSSEASLASTASRPTSVTVTKRPFVKGRDGRGCSFDLGWRQNELFLQARLDRADQFDPS